MEILFLIVYSYLFIGFLFLLVVSIGVKRDTNLYAEKYEIVKHKISRTQAALRIIVGCLLFWPIILLPSGNKK